MEGQQIPPAALLHPTLPPTHPPTLYQVLDEYEAAYAEEREEGWGPGGPYAPFLAMMQARGWPWAGWGGEGWLPPLKQPARHTAQPAAYFSCPPILTTATATPP